MWCNQTSLHNSPYKSDLQIWHLTLTNNEVMPECPNVMHIFEILMIVPFENVIVEHLLSWMDRVKTDFCNRLSRCKWICVCMLQKKGLAAKILRLIAVWIIGGHRRKGISSHAHIIILQKSIPIWIPKSVLTLMIDTCQHLRYVIWKIVMTKNTLSLLKNNNGLFSDNLGPIKFEKHFDSLAPAMMGLAGDI